MRILVQTADTTTRVPSRQSGKCQHVRCQLAELSQSQAANGASAARYIAIYGTMQCISIDAYSPCTRDAPGVQSIHWRCGGTYHIIDWIRRDSEAEGGASLVSHHVLDLHASHRQKAGGFTDLNPENLQKPRKGGKPTLQEHVTRSWSSRH